MSARISDPGVSAMLSLKLKEIPLGALSMIALFTSTNLGAGQSADLAWLGSAPSFREWVGQRLAHSPHAFDFAIRNKPWENSADIKLDLLETDKTGELQMWMDDFIATIPLFYEEQIADLINNAGSRLSFDGQNFFSTTHGYAKTGTFSNDIQYDATTTTAVTPLEAARAIVKVVNAMIVLPDDNGRGIINRGMNAICIACKAGTVNAASIMEAATADELDTGAGVIGNPLRSYRDSMKIEVHADPLLTTDETTFSVFRSRSGGQNPRPIVWQENKAMTRIDLLGEGSDYVVLKRAYLLALSKVGNGGYGIPQHACRCTFI